MDGSVLEPRQIMTEDISCLIQIGSSELCTKVTFEVKPFSEGESRYAYKGRYVNPYTKKEISVVVKKFKPSIKLASDWETDLITARRAAELAKEFNKALGCRCINIEEFTRLNVTESFSGNLKVGETVAAERYFDGEYTKWIGNNGWVNPRKVSDYLPAFSHWTWVVSGRQELVCDLQGVYGNCYVLADPAIHSLEQKYGITDFGKLGIHKFFETHKCTEICKKLKLNEAKVFHCLPVPRLEMDRGRTCFFGKDRDIINLNMDLMLNF